MKQAVILILMMLSLVPTKAQRQLTYNVDSLQASLKHTGEDTNRVITLVNLAQSYFFKEPDTSLYYSQQALNLSRKLNYVRGVQESQYRVGESLRLRGRYTEALKVQFDILEFNESLEDQHQIANALGFIGINYFQMNHFEQGRSYLKQGLAKRKKIFQETGVHQPAETLFTIYLGNSYVETGELDSAFYFLKEARNLLNGPAVGPQLKMLWVMSFSDALNRAGNYDSARIYFNRSLRFAREHSDMVPMHTSMAMIKVARLFNSQDMRDSSFYFAQSALRIAKDKKLNAQILESTRLLSQFHRKYGNLDSAFFYQDIATVMNDSIYGPEKLREQQLLLLEEQRRILELRQTQERFKSNIQLIGLVTITTVILVTSLLLFRSNRTKQKTNMALQQTIRELKATQTQLIQSEKMASLGELTAGIAHEIQNPLNFVNNFSEVNVELIDDLKEEIASGNNLSAKQLADTIKSNEEKINQHGKRADGIVKSMLQHSRTSSGQKELTDINSLCDEYLRLAYHGFRAKDKSFNTTMETNFDPSVRSLNIIPQDIGRVILNLINNAFYAVNEKSKTAIRDYLPTVTVSTKRLADRIEIQVRDNGNGIPDAIMEKIFQPFFTTKPTGQGTGLGLSLSYDIVKAHGGVLEVKSSEGVGSEFLILLPSKTE